MVSIYTLGYGGRKLEDFISLLKQHNISLVVDVRRFPRSKNPEFTKEELEVNLPKYGIGYMFMGEFLGGFRRGGYKKYADENPKYMEGVERLLKLTEYHTLALMCKIRKVSGCHRRYIIETLKSLNIQVINLP